jgi:hypothetical protein
MDRGENEGGRWGGPIELALRGFHDCLLHKILGVGFRTGFLAGKEKKARNIRFRPALPFNFMKYIAHELRLLL